MAIGVASGSVVITATIRVPSTASGTGNVTVDTVTTSLSSTLGTVASAIVTLGVPAMRAPARPLTGDEASLLVEVIPRMASTLVS